MNEGLAVLALALLGLGGWRVSLLLYPWKDCPACGGARRIGDGAGNHRDCGKCGTTGRVRRFGAPREERR